MKTTLLIFLLALSCLAFSQQSDLGTWNVVNTKVNLTSKWSVFNELQLRSMSFYNHFYYYEIKGGVAYAINKNFSFLVGSGKYMTYSDSGNFKKPVTADEVRLWEQITMNHYLDRIKFEHRYRVEQRWLKSGYRNRFRYRLAGAIPFNKNKFETGTIYFTAFDEVFFTNSAPYFERNRIFAGAGYQFSKHVTLQPGWLYQFDYRDNKGTGKHFFQLTAMLEFNAEKRRHDKIPLNED